MIVVYLLLSDLTNGKVHEIEVARKMQFLAESILVFDMGYYDFSWWLNLDSMKIWFVTRAKGNIDFEVLSDLDIANEKDKNVLQNCIIRFKVSKAQKDYSKNLRMVRFWDEINNTELQQRSLKLTRSVGTLKPSLRSLNRT